MCEIKGSRLASAINLTIQYKDCIHSVNKLNTEKYSVYFAKSENSNNFAFVIRKSIFTTN